MKTTTLIARVKRTQLFLDMGQKSGKQQQCVGRKRSDQHPPPRALALPVHTAAQTVEASSRVLYSGRIKLKSGYICDVWLVTPPYSGPLTGGCVCVCVCGDLGVCDQFGCFVTCVTFFFHGG